MKLPRSTPLRLAASMVAISFGLFAAACEKDGASTTPPDGDAPAAEGGDEEEPAEAGGGGW